MTTREIVCLTAGALAYHVITTLIKALKDWNHDRRTN